MEINPSGCPAHIDLVARKRTPTLKSDGKLFEGSIPIGSSLAGSERTFSRQFWVWSGGS